MLAFIRKHPTGVGSGAVLTVLGLAWLAFGYFGVHTLFIDDVVDEAGPVFDATPAAVVADGASAAPQTPVLGEAPASADTTATSPEAAASPSTSPPVEPTAITAESTPAEEPAAVEPARPPAGTVPPTPEIVTEYSGVFESDAHPTAGNAAVLGNGTGQRFLRLDDFETDNGPDLNVYLVNSSTGDVSDYIDLGDLKGNIGDQNYEIPERVDLDVYDEVVIWCVRFGVGFGDALLAPA